MDSVEIPVNTSNDSVNIGGNTQEDVEDDFNVRRKSKINVLVSDDDENENENEDVGGNDKADSNIDDKEKEVISESGEVNRSELHAIENNKVNTNLCCNRIDALLSNFSNSVRELSDLSSALEMNILEREIAEDDDEKSEVIINNNEYNSKSTIGGDTARPTETGNGLIETPDLSTEINIDEDDTKSEEKSKKNFKRFTTILDSDSSSDDERIFGSSSLDRKKISHKNNKASDSRSSSPNSDIPSQGNDNKVIKAARRPGRVVESESEGEENIGDRKETLGTKNREDCGSFLKSVKQNKISAVIDTDSEEESTASSHKFRGSSGESEIQPLGKSNATRKRELKPEKKKRTGSIRAAKEKAMHEIHSESQRMLRETQVSLPYHRPKQRTLQEFLNRRKALPTLPGTMTTAAKLRISGEIVGKALEEKMKEAQLFYKSSSDSDNEEMSKEVGSSNSKIDESNIESISAIEETQKLVKNDPKNSQGNKEAIQQGDKSIGVPRKLFNNSENEAEGTEDRSPIDEDDFEEAMKEDQLCNHKRNKEFKQGLKEVSVPKKLFGLDCPEPMDTDSNKADTNHERMNDKIGKIVEIHKPMNEICVKDSTVRRNESMEEEGDDFVLKMSEDPYEIINDDHDKPDDIPISENSTKEFKAITETPFINNLKEASKLNEGDETDSGIITAEENLARDDRTVYEDVDSSSEENGLPESINSKDSGDKNEPIGHVYGIPLSDSEEDEPKIIKKEILPDIMKLTPKLQGSPDMMIELSPAKKKGVNQLIKRFLNHSVVKKGPESSPEVIVTRTEQTENGLRVINEVLPYRIPMNEKNDDPELSKPGAKLTRLKEDLQQQMAIQRNREWKQKEIEMKSLEENDEDEVYRGELSDCGMEEDNDDDEEKEEGDDDSEESELEEDDLPLRETKKKYKSPFVDGEADVSGDEEEEKEEEEEVSEEEDREDENSDNSSGDESEAKKDNNKSSNLKRIVKAFDDEDSDDEEVKETHENRNNADHCRFKRTITDVDMFATDNNSDDDWLSGGEDDLPAYQQRRDERSQACATPSVGNNSLNIVSPITQLTALNTGSESGNLDSSWGQSSFQFIAPLNSVENTPIEIKSYRECDSEKLEKLQKKLFDDVRETPNDTELMGLCSGKFTQNPNDDDKEINKLDKLIDPNRKTNVSDSELMDLCSGTFATQQTDMKKLENCCEKVNDSSELFISSEKSSKEQFCIEKIVESSSKVRIVFSSDDENDENDSEIKNTKEKSLKEKKNLKKKVRQLQLSDDEEEGESGNENFDEREDEEEQFIDYDSDENEIIVPRNDIKKVAARFLDEEAELSGSEEGSADEDERYLDKLDLEEGDLDDIDQDQVKNQLEKIHMRQVLDADQREVRLLQEILLEDGELHSDNASRQRKFKWKNIDELGEDSETPLRNLDEEGVSVDPNEAESELEWRKQRLQREQFLQEQRLKEAAADVAEEEKEEDSQLFKLGIKALKKNKNSKLPGKDIPQTIVVEKSQTTSVIRHTVADLFASPGCEKKTFALQNAIHRGSFLARGEESLARLSVITKQNSDQAIIRNKKSRNFVFAHISPAIEALNETEEFEDQENTSVTDSKIRKRKPASSLTPTTSKKSKKEYERSSINTRNKLFS